MWPQRAVARSRVTSPSDNRVAQRWGSQRLHNRRSSLETVFICVVCGFNFFQRWSMRQLLVMNSDWAVKYLEIVGKSLPVSSHWELIMRHGGSHQESCIYSLQLRDSLCVSHIVTDCHRLFSPCGNVAPVGSGAQSCHFAFRKSCRSALGVPKIAQMSPVPWRLCLSVWFEGSLVLGDATTVGDELNCVNTWGQKPASKLSLGAYYEAWG